MLQINGTMRLLLGKLLYVYSSCFKQSQAPLKSGLPYLCKALGFQNPKLNLKRCHQQSVTSRLETSRYRDFSQYFESIGLGLENFGLEKKVSVSVSKTLVSKKVSVSVSKILVSKKSQYRSQKLCFKKKF